ncbi:MAG TPA: DUF4136 domain-containing protein [Gammaproteobacteria bacterium]
MKIYSLLIAILFSALLTSCSTLSVSYDYNQDIDFTHYKTYDWMPFPENIKSDSLNLTRFINAVEKNLAEKNINKETSSPDFLIAPHFVKERRINITDWGYYYAPSVVYTRRGYVYYDRYGYYPSGGISVYEYEQGTLILDFIDADNKQLIWRATAKSIISPASTPQKQTEKINKAVNEILRSFPPQTDKK